MKRVIKASTDMLIEKFVVGATYRASMLYGGYETYKVVDRTDTTVTLEGSHISEDDGMDVYDGVKEYPIVMQNLYDESYDNVIGKQESVEIWEYKGHKGYLYAN